MIRRFDHFLKLSGHFHLMHNLMPQFQKYNNLDLIMMGFLMNNYAYSKMELDSEDAKFELKKIEKAILRMT